MVKIFLVALFSVSALLCIAQGNDNLYKKQWKEIDSLLFKQSLSRSALEKVNAIYKQAKEKDQQVQLIKALLYRFVLEDKVTDLDINYQVKKIVAETESAKDLLTKSILASLTAATYRDYFEQNRWNLYKRSKTIDFKKEDIATWSADDFQTAITYWYQQSLKGQAALQQTDIGIYNPVLTLYNTKVLRPTLYDLLAHRALTYFTSDETYVTQPLYAFTISDAAALRSIEAFTTHAFTTKDSLSNKWKALLLFQQLIHFHAGRKDTAALIDVNLERIAFARTNGTIAQADSLYYAAVQENAERFKANPYSAQAWYLLAAWHAEKAAQYKANGDTTYRWENLKALAICKKFMPLTDSTEGHTNLFNLYHSIMANHLQLTTEEVNVPGAPFRTLVTYKNINRLYYRIISVTGKIEDVLARSRIKKGWDKYIDTASSFAFLQQQQIDLPGVRDYQQHLAEIKINSLPAGKYMLLASSSANFSNNSRLALSSFYVSNISFVNNGQHYFVLDRTTGQPLVNASVTVWENNYNNLKGGYDRTKQESYLTDKNGYFKIPLKEDDYRNVDLQIGYKQDELFLDNNLNVTPLIWRDSEDDDDEDSDEEYEDDQLKTYFFKDRSIYRPGQMVYFKMLALTKDRKTKKAKLYTRINAKDKEYVYLHDANSKRIDSLPLKLNEYGSFAGNFKLPVNVLTGDFSLTTSLDSEDEGEEFSVEEYKRPTFFVEMEKPKGSYRLNDTLTISGTAKAYAGNTVDGANIKYSVKRKGRFLYPWLWYRGTRPFSAETTITFGEAKTDAAGKFTIKFAAIPDEATAKKLLPVFDYEVNADVTDIAGETRNSLITVSAGYHSLNLKVSIKETADADSLKIFFVSTENIGGDKEPAAVQISIYPLQSPDYLIRKSYWPQPDQFLYSQEEYKQYFPHDEYKNENDKANWPRSAAIFSTAINTKESGKIEIPKGTLAAGWYVVEATTTDKDGNEIKDAKYVQLFSKRDGEFKGSDYLFSSVVNNVTMPAIPASFIIGSSAEHVHLIQETQHLPKPKSTLVHSDFIFYDVNKTVKEITVTPKSDDIGGIGVNFLFVKDNRVYTSNQRVQVTEEASDLDVEILTYRDKIKPGSQEKWTIKITGRNKEAAAAEVLTSMYDASLDQFKPHLWQVPQEPLRTFYGNGWNNGNGFTRVESNGNNLPVPGKYFYKAYADIDVNLSNGPISPQHMKIERRLAGRADGVDLIQSQNLNEVVVTGYGVAKRQSLTGAVSSVTVRGISSLTGSDNPLYVIDGKIMSSSGDINPDDIGSVEVLKGAAATTLYGAKGANGVVVITTKGGSSKHEEPVLKIRTNFNETAFFFPQMQTDEEGNFSFTFALPDALTQWKWQIIAHDKQANFGIAQKTIVSQKTLMIQANAPRFMREGDSMQFSAKVSNLSDKELSGKATLQLLDAATLQPVDNLFSNIKPVQSFTIGAGQSTPVLFSIAIPANFNKALTWKIIAKAGGFADGEENSLPVLTNRMLVMESLPLFVKGDTTKKFTFTKLLNQQSNTLQHHAITVEYTSNPVWYALQSLPYLVEFPYECSEQTFNRFFANALAAHIINSNPKIKQVFELWKKDTSALKSNLQKNEELKNVLLQETPWVLQAESEEQQKKNLALLFDAFTLGQSFKTNLEKLKQMQLGSGGFTWFKGGNEDRYITQYIITGIGRLQKMNAIPAAQNEALTEMAKNAFQYLDKEITREYKSLQNDKSDLKKNNTGALQIQYLYAKSFFADNSREKKNNEAYNFYYRQAKQFWNGQSNYLKAMTGEVLARNNDRLFVLQNILPALRENAVTGEETGMYWKENEHSYYWYHAPVEQQALMIEFFHEMQPSGSPLAAELGRQIDEMKTWLLRQKQTNNWSTTKATADACYALLLNGSDWISADKKVIITTGDYSFSSAGQTTEAGSGYFKNMIESARVNAQMGNITVTTSSDNSAKNSAPSWGAVYWQYFEDLDKITPAATPLLINKKLFIQQNTDRGIVLQPVNNGDEMKVGDKVKIHVEIKVDRNMEYVHLKDMRAAGMEPVNVLSGYRYQDGLGYYESTRDAATNFFISFLPKGTYVFEYPVTITHTGNYSVGIATAQCMYAPEFNSHSEGIRIKVK